ncbi:capsid assembly protein [Thalassospira alkalitolerans]|uniref:capsid assembly protein n=1 Tax=Thalassospira alkalitolerans TaxID=1293890 RepID=UPI0030EB3D06|tara:strand:+ start:12332 stop:13090 length:759 start_codon:yes stop_codon:yes gene_type:complete
MSMGHQNTAESLLTPALSPTAEALDAGQGDAGNPPMPLAGEPDLGTNPSVPGASEPSSRPDAGLGPDPAVDSMTDGENAALLTVPETPDGYEISVDAVLGAVDPALNERLHQAGFTGVQAQLVYDLAAEVIGPMVGEIDTAGQRAADRATLVAEFGGAQNWARLAPKIEKWGQENLPGAAFDVLCQSADGVRTLHRLMTGGAEPGLNGGNGAGGGDLRSEIRTKMNDPRYWRDRDPGLVAEVQAAFDRLQDG